MSGVSNVVLPSPPADDFPDPPNPPLPPAPPPPPPGPQKLASPPPPPGPHKLKSPPKASSTRDLEWTLKTKPNAADQSKEDEVDCWAGLSMFSTVAEMRQEAEAWDRRCWEGVLEAFDNVSEVIVDLKARLILARLPQVSTDVHSVQGSNGRQGKGFENDIEIDDNELWGAQTRALAGALQLRRKAEVCQQGCWTFCNQQLEAMAEKVVKMQHQTMIIEAAVKERTKEIQKQKEALTRENQRLAMEMQMKIDVLQKDLAFSDLVLDRARKNTWRLLFAWWSDDLLLIQELTYRTLVIQKFGRGLLGRLCARRWRKKATAAALTIQKTYKGHRDRGQVALLRELLTRIAVSLQRRVKGWETRRRVRELKNKHRLRISRFVVPIVRSCLRRDWYDIVMVEWNANALAIQRVWRGILGRRRAAEKRRKRDEEMTVKQHIEAEQRRLEAEKRRQREAEEAKKKRDAEYQAEVKRRQEEQKQKEAQRIKEMQEQKAMEEVRRRKEAEERKKKEKEQAEQEKQKKAEMRKKMSQKIAEQAALEAVKEAGRKKDAQNAVAAAAQAAEEKKKIRLLEEKRKKEEEKKKRQHKERKKEDRRKRANELHKPWTNNDEEIQAMRDFLLDKYNGPKGVFRIIDHRLDPATLFEETELKDFLYSAGYCLHFRAERLFEVLDTKNQGILTPEQVLGQERAERKIKSAPQKTWSATSNEIEELSQVQPDVRVVQLINGSLKEIGLEDEGPEGEQVQLVEWVIPGAHRFLKPGVCLRCAPFDALGETNIELEFRPSEEVGGANLCSLFCRGESGMHFRLAFFVGLAQAFPQDMKIEDEPGSKEWWGVEGFCNAEAQTTNDGDLKLGFVVVENLAPFDTSVGIEQPIFGDDDSVVLRWHMHKLKLLRQYYPRGLAIKSNEFSALGLSGLSLEFFPTGSFDCEKAKCCSLHLHAPVGVLLGISFYVESSSGDRYGLKFPGPELNEFRFAGQPAKATELILYDQVLGEFDDEFVIGAEIRPGEGRRKDRLAQLKSFGVL